MRSLIVFSSLILIIPSLFFTVELGAAAKRLHIEGLKVIEASELLTAVNAGGERTSSATGEIIADIENFYRGRGYPLVRVHVISDTAGELSLYVDEGRLGKIVVHESNNYYALKYKQAINVPGRIYSPEVIQKNIDELKRKYGFAEVITKLEKIPDYDDNVIQIDRELNRIVLFDQKIRIFSQYPAEYELHFYFDYGEGRKGPGLRRNGWGFSIDYDYPSLFIPEISLYTSDLLIEKDYFEADFSAGFDPGLGGLLNLHPRNTLEFPPRRTFSMVESEYRFSPLDYAFFTPVIRGRIYHSAGGRSDLGYSSFKYLSLRGTLAPGITPFEDLNLYAGVGCEFDRFYEIEEDTHVSGRDEISEGWHNYPFTEIRLIFDPLPFRIGTRKERNYTLTFTHYFDGVEFSELLVRGAHDFEFSNLSILSFRVMGVFNNSNAPFNHHAPVSSQYFKGFTGLSYHANRLAELSSEYRFSVYQDYIYTGLFMDWAFFRPEGLMISGGKAGVVAGPTVRFLVYDQFEFIIYVGWDRLFPDGSSQKNIKVRLTRTW